MRRLIQYSPNSRTKQAIINYIVGCNKQFSDNIVYKEWCLL